MIRKASHVPAYPCLTQLMTRGTFYDVGYNVGLTFSERIRYFFAESDNIQGKLFPFYHSQAGRVYYEESLRICQDCFPQYVREVRGIADGAGLPFEHVFMANISKEVYNVLFDEWKHEGGALKGEDSRNLPRVGSSKELRWQHASKEEINDTLQMSKKRSSHSPTQENHGCTSKEEGQSDSLQMSKKRSSHSPTQENHGCTSKEGGQSDSLQISKKRSTNSPFQENYGCSDVFINRPGYQFIIHNEDCDPMIKPYGYLLSAEIEENGEKEQFTSFTYPGFLSGCAWSYNMHGLTLSINGLYPDHIVKHAPSRLFINRSLLKAKDVADAVRLAQNSPWGVAYGFCTNISTKEGRMVSMEVGPGKPKGLVHVYDISQQSDTAAPYHYYHFNSYKQLTEVSEIEGLMSSTLRGQRAEELSPPHTLQDALDVMSDTKDPLGPIFRTPRPTDLGETVCTAVFDVTARQVLVYQGREDLLTDKPFAKLPMYQ